MRHDGYETHLTYVSYMLTVIPGHTAPDHVCCCFAHKMVEECAGNPSHHLRAVQYAQLRDLLARLPSAGGAGSSW